MTLAHIDQQVGVEYLRGIRFERPCKIVSTVSCLRESRHALLSPPDCRYSAEGTWSFVGLVGSDVASILST